MPVSGSNRRSIEDFIEYGPAWDCAPAHVVAGLISSLGLSAPAWLQPGFDPYSKAWHAVENGDEEQALELAIREDPLRAYRHSKIFSCGPRKEA